jgi:NLR family CARD domain-containing protein 3
VDIANSLVANRRLAFLALDHNQIGDPGSSAIVLALDGTTVPTMPSSRGNSIGPVGAVVMVQTFEIEHVLDELAMGKNSIGDDGSAPIADALSGNSIVAKHDLRDN